MSQISVEEMKNAQETFRELIKTEEERIKRMKASEQVKDFSKLTRIKVGILPGDGVGRLNPDGENRVLKELVETGNLIRQIELHNIEGMTIENRVEKMSLPDEVLEEVKM